MPSTGPEHYREAERDIERANDRPMGGEAEFMLARAQVHATLALAAATATSLLNPGPWARFFGPAAPSTQSQKEN